MRLSVVGYGKVYGLCKRVPESSALSGARGLVHKGRDVTGIKLEHVGARLPPSRSRKGTEVALLRWLGTVSESWSSFCPLHVPAVFCSMHDISPVSTTKLPSHVQL
jgi:hypothetical protein